MTNLTPIEPQRIDELDFLDHKFGIAVLGDGFGYVSVKTLCEMFSVDPKAQTRRINRNNSYFEEYTAIIIMPTPGGDQATFCLRADAIPIFLTGINLFNVKDQDAFDLLERFIKENHIVLAEYWGIADREQIMVTRRTIESLLLEHGHMEGMTKEEGKKIVDQLQEMQDDVEKKVDKIRLAFLDLRTDVRKMQQYVGPTNTITEEQQAEVKNKVNQLARLKIEHLGIPSPYGAIYDSIHRQFGVTSYKAIKMEHLIDVIAFLDDEMNAVLRAAKNK